VRPDPGIWSVLRRSVGTPLGILRCKVARDHLIGESDSRSHLILGEPPPAIGRTISPEFNDALRLGVHCVAQAAVRRRVAVVPPGEVVGGGEMLTGSLASSGADLGGDAKVLIATLARDLKERDKAVVDATLIRVEGDVTRAAIAIPPEWRPKSADDVLIIAEHRFHYRDVPSVCQPPFVGSRVIGLRSDSCVRSGGDFVCSRAQPAY
jgi:hypothetical protein